MILTKSLASFLKVIGFGIFAGALCALMDLFPSENIWTFSSFSGSLGFWATTGMIILMQSENRKLAGLNTFLYFGFMNTTFFFVHLILPFQYPRISSLAQAYTESLIWLIPSFICGLCAMIAFQAKKHDKWGTFALSLPLGLLLFESIATICSVFINHKYLFQFLVNLAGLIALFVLYRGKKNTGLLIAATLTICITLIAYDMITNGNILYY